MTQKVTEEMVEAGVATPAAELERQMLSYSVPKNEREWWAMKEIERLRALTLPDTEGISSFYQLSHPLDATEPAREGPEEDSISILLTDLEIATATENQRHTAAQWLRKIRLEAVLTDRQARSQRDE